MSGAHEDVAETQPERYDDDTLPPDAPPAPAEPGPLLGMVEAVDRHGVQARLPVRQWPVTVGRDLHADLVLDDSHVAPLHLRLEQGTPGQILVTVLETHNGVALGRQRFARGARFAWRAGETLAIGRLHLRLRLAGVPVEPEVPLPHLPWRNGLLSLVAVSLLLLVMVSEVWLRSADTQRLGQELPVALVGAFAALMSWAGLWALLTKLFSGHAQFWRHVRIASLAFVVTEVLDFSVHVLAFAFSWESVGRFSYMLVVLVVAVAIYRHLLVVAPQPRRGLAVGVALVVLLGLPVVLGTQWLKNQRLSNQLYMSKLFPPSWRVAAPVPVDVFLDEARSIEQRLQRRLGDSRDEDAADASESSEDEE